ncbi:alkaline phosphatase family protein [Labrenzia sp. PHM005]|uniref:alkaline phosphatase family protein n=1 Tax=Labrenzia sp. PHM005 TaxID=2590016 RepID=UPI0011407B1E|nr:alkaline phosphatase family protein [Labrenzia sp. PHM005]QDG77954.1 PglZ domain-containing protein [Labrenzia sp. PHM005]
MANPVCLIIIDGLRHDTAIEECGYLMAAVEAKQARAWQMQSCLPTISAPLYETIHTGLAPIEHGILSNEAIRPSNKPNVFSTLKTAGKTTGAVAHSYYHTLYGGTAFDPFEHTEINDPDAPVPYARYYSMEGYSKVNPALPSETDLCAQTWILAQTHKPDYLLLHSSSCDSLGHYYTSSSAEYRHQAWRVDNALSRLIPRLRDAGYDVLVTADHGMNEDGHHAGDQPGLRAVPFFVFSDRFKAPENEILDQKAIAPTILALLETPIPQSMTSKALT